MFEESYAPIAGYIHAHYHRARTVTFMDNRSWDVYAANVREATSEGEEGLPCYR